MWIEILICPGTLLVSEVTPLAGVWIEITWYWVKDFAFNVTPLAGVWIEICYYNSAKSISKASLPLRECGLKYAAVAKLVPV